LRITNLEDARFAVQAGADMLGFNFYRPSSRYIDPLAALAIIEELSAPDLLTVGRVCHEASPDVVERIAKASALAHCSYTAMNRRVLPFPKAMERDQGIAS